MYFSWARRNPFRTSKSGLIERQRCPSAVTVFALSLEKPLRNSFAITHRQYIQLLLSGLRVFLSRSVQGNSASVESRTTNTTNNSINLAKNGTMNSRLGNFHKQISHCVEYTMFKTTKLRTPKTGSASEDLAMQYIHVAGASPNKSVRTSVGMACTRQKCETPSGNQAAVQ